MGDRVEERMESERLDRIRMEQKSTENKRTDTTREFSRQMASVQQTKSTRGAQEQGKQQQQSRASVRLLVRAGISNQKRSGKMYTEGEKRMLAQRDGEHGKDAELAARSSLQQKGKDQASSRADALTHNPVSARDKAGQKDKNETSRQAGESRREQIIGGQGGYAAVMGMGGVSTKSSSGAGATKLTTAQIVDQIVKSVRAGVDAKGFGIMQIELKDDVLAGANLSIHSTSDGVALKVQTNDDEVSRLLSSGATAHELTVALKGKGINLKTLEVNDNKVIH